MWQALWKLRLLYITLKRVHVWGQWGGGDQGCSVEVLGFIDAKLSDAERKMYDNDMTVIEIREAVLASNREKKKVWGQMG